jgi:peptide/nickel transport system ATP-binding protein
MTAAPAPDGAPMPILSVRELSVEFVARHGRLTALDNVSLSIAAGEILGLVGESGAGKSLTGSAVIGLIEPPGRLSGGEIWLAGQRIDHLTGAAMRRIRGRRIGIVFQDPLTSLDPLQSIGAQLIETIRTHLPLSSSEARSRAIDLLQEVGIAAAAARLSAYPHEFSGGMRQRVVIALALAPGPELIIADEPTTALDVSVQAQIIALLKRLCRQSGTAILLITHDMGVIAAAADRVAVMYAGRLIETGTARALIAAPRHPYSRGLMGSIPSLARPRPRLVQIPGAMPGLADLPAGCAFHPRCPAVLARCRVERPLLQGEDGSQVACWVASETAERA